MCPSNVFKSYTKIPQSIRLLQSQSVIFHQGIPGNRALALVLEFTVRFKTNIEVLLHLRLIEFYIIGPFATIQAV